LQRRKTKKKNNYREIIQNREAKQRISLSNPFGQSIPKSTINQSHKRSKKLRKKKKKKKERQQKQQHGQQHLVLNSTQIAIRKENPNNINPLKFIPNPFGQSIPKSNINQIHIHTAEPT
jgi:hypothetical protein